MEVKMRAIRRPFVPTCAGCTSGQASRNGCAQQDPERQDQAQVLPVEGDVCRQHARAARMGHRGEHQAGRGRQHDTHRGTPLGQRAGL